MIIAIMGDTFNRYNEMQSQLKIKDHLEFILDNWYLNEYQKDHNKKIKYIFCAFLSKAEGEKETEIIH